VAALPVALRIVKCADRGVVSLRPSRHDCGRESKYSDAA